MLCHFKKWIKNSIFCHFEKIYRKNNNCRVAMTTTYYSTSCNSENIVACSYLVARGYCMHVRISSYYYYATASTWRGKQVGEKRV